jgi:hypothetical protein
MFSLSVFGLFSQDLRTHRELTILKEQYLLSDSSFHFTLRPYLPDEPALYRSREKKVFKNDRLNKMFNEDLLHRKSNKGEIKLNPVFTAEYSSNKDVGFKQNYHAGIKLFTSYDRKLFLNTELYYCLQNLSGQEKMFIDSFDILPYFGKPVHAFRDNYGSLQFSAELTYKPTSHIYFHIGRGKHFIGNGYHSLFLSDQTHLYPYVKTSVNIWKIKYIWMFAKLDDYELSGIAETNELRDKALFLHYLSLNLTERININFFEALITNPYDLNGKRKGYEIAYFNPVIFYRPVEFYSGSSDNSLMGLGLNLKFFKAVYGYSQFILDDLVISSIKERSGWWGNKFGLQAGIKAFDVFKLKGLFARYEFNLVRPYTFSHGSSYSDSDIINLNYGHYRQSLAHPLGANFKEHIAMIRYKKDRWFAGLKFSDARMGLDSDSLNYGSDIYKAYNSRPEDYNIKLLQGSIRNFKTVELSLSYLLNPSYDLVIKSSLSYSDRYGIGNNPFGFLFGLSALIFSSTSDYALIFRP